MKKVFSLLLSLIICISSVNIVIAADGMYSGGTGSEQDPYLITNEEELRLLAEQVNTGNAYEGTCFRLENDIELTESWIPIGEGKVDLTTKEHVEGELSFNGVFDGNGHTISNVLADYYAELDDNGKKESLYLHNIVGFFGYTYNAVIKNLTVDGKVTGNERVGGIVGYAANGTYISGCTNKAMVIGENRVGGIAGEVGPGTIPNGGKVIDNCVNDGVVCSRLYIYKQQNPVSQGVGGIVGYVNSDKTVIYKSINKGTVWSSYNLAKNSNITWRESNHYDGIGGVAGYVNAGTIEECENNNAVFGERRVGGVVGTLNKDGKVIKSGSAKDKNNDQINPRIENELIDIGAETEEDTVQDKYSARSMCFGGVVGTNEGGTISECYANDTTLLGYERVGGIVGHNSGKVENCTAENNHIIGSSVSYESTTLKINPFYTYTGGIVGYNMSVIDGCTSKQCDIDSLYNAVGGICGFDDKDSDTLINKCKTINCNITDDIYHNTAYNSYIGGIAGVGKNIKDSWTEGDTGVILGHEYVGGIVGRNIGVVDGCHNMSIITGDSNIGGIVGENVKGAKITNCYNERFFRGKGTYLGGVVGLNRGNVESCYNTGAIEVGDAGLFEHAGGIAGRNDIGAVIDKCYNEASISGKNNIGGILGINDNGTVKNCYNEGAISGQDKVGGIVGLNEWMSASSETAKDAYIVNSFNKGAVDGGTDVTNAGGISGINQGYIDNCYNSGEVKYAETQAGYRGLIAGKSPEHSKIMNSYSKEYAVPLCGSEIDGVIDSSTVGTVVKSKESLTLKKLNDYVKEDTENNLVNWGYIKGEPELLLNGEKSNIARVVLEQVEGGTIKFADTDDSYRFIEKGAEVSVIVTVGENSKFSGLLYSGGFISVDDMTLSEDGVYTFKAPDEFDIAFSPVFGDGTFIIGGKCYNSNGDVVDKSVDVGDIAKLSIGMMTTSTSLKPDMIVAAYDYYDNFISVVTFEKDCEFADKKVTWTFDNISVPTGTSKLKIFAWDGIDTMQPVANNIYTIYFASAYVTNGLKLQLDSVFSKLEDNKWYNTVGNNYYILNNVTVGEDFLGFNGTDSYAQSSEDVDMGSSARTIEIALDNSQYNSNRSSYIFGMGTEDKSNLLIGINKNNNIMVYAANSSNIIEYSSDSIKSIAVTVGENSVKIYVNGECVKALQVSVNTSAGKIRLGNSSNINTDGSTPDRFWKGDIHSVRMYDRELSDEEVRSNYNADVKRFGE